MHNSRHWNKVATMPDRVVQKNVSEQFSLWVRIVVGIGAVLLTAGALISLCIRFCWFPRMTKSIRRCGWSRLTPFRATWGWQSRVSHGSAVTSACHAERHVATDGLHAIAGRVYLLSGSSLGNCPSRGRYRGALLFGSRISLRSTILENTDLETPSVVASVSLSER